MHRVQHGHAAHLAAPNQGGLAALLGAQQYGAGVSVLGAVHGAVSYSSQNLGLGG